MTLYNVDGKIIRTSLYDLLRPIKHIRLVNFYKTCDYKNGSMVNRIKHTVPSFTSYDSV